MFSLDDKTVVDLSPLLKARIHRVDGSIEEGNTDPNGKPWVMTEGRYAGDNSLFTLYGAPSTGDDVWPAERQTAHHGVHVQGGGGHICHWSGVPDAMKGIWEMPAETFVGDAAVCYLADLSPITAKERGDYPPVRVREGDTCGQEITPDHLSNVQVGDIVLLASPFDGTERPWLSEATCEWLVSDRNVRMVGFGAGIAWEYHLKLATPDNSPVKRVLLGADVPIVQPLVNIETLSKDRVFFMGLPLRMSKMEASFTRALAFEDK